MNCVPLEAASKSTPAHQVSWRIQAGSLFSSPGFAVELAWHLFIIWEARQCSGSEQGPGAWLPGSESPLCYLLVSLANYSTCRHCFLACRIEPMTVTPSKDGYEDWISWYMWALLSLLGKLLVSLLLLLLLLILLNSRSACVCSGIDWRVDPVIQCSKQVSEQCSLQALHLTLKSGRWMRFSSCPHGALWLWNAIRFFHLKQL